MASHRPAPGAVADYLAYDPKMSLDLLRLTPAALVLVDYDDTK